MIRRNGKDETGNRYGRLVVVSESGMIGRDVAWLCQCDCGNTTITRGTSLRMGRVRSCGCIIAEMGNGHRLPDGEAAFNSYYYKQKHGAELRGYSWNLTTEQVRDINSKNCAYCGAAPSMIFTKGKSSGQYVYNGIDRINNDIGYEPDNVVSCCKSCNRMKLNHSLIEFKKHISRIYFHAVLGVPYSDDE